MKTLLKPISELIDQILHDDALPEVIQSAMLVASVADIPPQFDIELQTLFWYIQG